jgi:thiazole synthase
MNDGNDDILHVGSYKFKSRLLVGTGKYKNAQIARDAIIASEAEVVTVALRRVNLQSHIPSITTVITPDMVTYLPNSAGCYTAAEAVRTLRLAREIGGFNLVKLEVIGDKNLLYPDVIETIKAAEILIDDGFEVMAYTSDDPLIAMRLEEVGCAAIMPIGSPIGSGQGVKNQFNIQTIVEQSSLPVILDAGIGTASDAAIAMELGCAGVLLNTALAEAQNPILMAKAMRDAVRAGRAAYFAGRMAKRAYAVASSPEQNLI